MGSLRNKLLILLPVALVLSYFLPGAIIAATDVWRRLSLLRGTEKVYALLPHQAHAHEAQLDTVALNPKTFEDEKVAGAIKTDFILSAEIMAISLAAVPETSVWTQAFVLALVGIAITVGVYGAVALNREGRRCRRDACRESIVRL